MVDNLFNIKTILAKTQTSQNKRTIKKSEIYGERCELHKIEKILHIKTDYANKKILK